MAANRRPANSKPKGRPTRRRARHGSGGISPGLQWLLVVLFGVVAAIVLIRLIAGV